MKPLYIIVALGILIIGFLLLTEKTDENSSVVGNESEEMMETSNTNTDTDSSSESEDMEDMSHDSVDTDEEAGSVVDAEVDASVDVEVNPSPVTSAKTFTIDSFNFGYSLSEIRVKKGDTVTINLTNSDGFHDWVVDEFSVATTKINVGGTTSVTFVADKTGTFEYYCSVGSHRQSGMVGKLIVE